MPEPIHVTILGTTCMVPTKERNHSASLLRYNQYGLLFDCGEGTQRQIKLADLRLTEITHLFISHWHGDHVLGIPGLLQSLGAAEYQHTLHIYGPKGTQEHMDNMLKAFVFDNRIDVQVHEIHHDGPILENRRFTVSAYHLEHGITTLGYRFIETDQRRINLEFIQKKGIPQGPLLGKLQANQSIIHNEETITPDQATYVVPGKKVGIIADTLLCPNCNRIAEDADLLISEASFASDLEDKAVENRHLTAQQAAQIASQNNVKKLVLTHFSARYKSTKPIEEDARVVFPDTICAYDLMKLKV
ncbi:MAG: ribonuclease Z [Nanobdellota archaeon]